MQKSSEKQFELFDVITIRATSFAWIFCFRGYATYFGCDDSFLWRIHFMTLFDLYVLRLWDFIRLYVCLKIREQFQQNFFTFKSNPRWDEGAKVMKTKLKVNKKILAIKSNHCNILRFLLFISFHLLFFYSSHLSVFFMCWWKDMSSCGLFFYYIFTHFHYRFSSPFSYTSEIMEKKIIVMWNESGYSIIRI